MHPRTAIQTLAVLLALLAMSRTAWAQEGEVKTPHARVQLVAQADALVPGRPLMLGLRFRLDPGWHIYWQNPGDSGEPPSMQWKLPDGFEAGPIRWPVPIRVFTAHLANYVYEGELVLPVSVQVPDTIDGEAVTLAADVSWLVCKEECIPGDAAVALRLPVRPEAKPSAHAALFDEAQRLQPRSAPIHATTLALHDDRYTLRLDADPLWVEAAAARTPVLVMPDEADIVPAAQTPQVTAEGGRLEIHWSRVPDTPVAHALTGLLVVGNGHERIGYRIGTGAPKIAATSSSEPAPRQAPASAVAYEAFGDGSGRPTSLWAALLLALAGGALLNLMPCVLPVLSLKVLGFVNQAQDEPDRIRRHGYAFGLGVVVTFWALAGLLLVLQGAGAKLGWGFQLQEPAVVAGMAFLMLALGLNLAGVFEIGAGIAGTAGRVSDRVKGSGYGPSFANGVLATVIATPCTAPFMVGAMSYAVDKPALTVLGVFTALGVGMAAPYVLLALFPRWLSKVPRPGPWMLTFRQAMSFPLFGTALWLVWVFTNQTGPDGLGWLLAGMTVASLGCWVYGRAARRSLIGVAAAACLVVAGIALGLWNAKYAGANAPTAPRTARADGEIDWIPFSEERVASLRAQGRPVFVDFTADWCIVCKANEAAFIESSEVLAAAKKHDLAFVKADWTRRDPRITDALARFNRNSVPVYAFYSADPERAPVVLNDTAITASTLVRALEHVVRAQK